MDEIIVRGVAFAIVVLMSQAAAAQAKDRDPPVLVHDPCVEYRTGQDFAVRVRIEDASRLFDPKIIYRSPPASSWKNIALEPHPDGDGYVAVIKGSRLRGPLDYFIEAFDEQGNGPASFGSDVEPVRVLPASRPEPCYQLPGTAPPATTEVSGDVASPEREVPGVDIGAPVPETQAGGCAGQKPALYCSPWFWGLVGGVVAVGLGVAIVLAVPKDERVADFATLNFEVTPLSHGERRW